MKRRETARPQQPASTSTLVQIEKPIYGGASLARVDGKAVFVPLTLPGEQVHVRIVEEKRSYATAEVDQIVSAAPQRVAPKCRHFGVCGGCHYQHAEYATQLDWKKAVLRETLERGGVRVPDEIDVVAAEPWEYRNRIRLAFDLQGNVGYRGRRSHDVIPIAECPIAAPLLVRAALAAHEAARKSDLSKWLREISFFCNAEETELMATVVMNRGAKVGIEAFADGLARDIPQLKGTEFLAERSDREPPSRVGMRGGASLTYRAAGIDYQVDHGAFFQVNRWLVDGLVDRVVGAQRGKLAWDLFAGVGLFARRLAERFESVTAVESAPAAVASLMQNLGGTNARAVKATTLEFLRGERKGTRPHMITPDLVVVDPPRAGLGSETATLLAEIGAPALTYVSCDPATLARDLRALGSAGYAIQDIALADLFPQTFHLETVVRLRR